jgi:hypothetical protein
MKGYRPAVFAAKGLMVGIRQPLHGPVFEKLPSRPSHAMSCQIEIEPPCPINKFSVIEVCLQVP